VDLEPAAKKEIVVEEQTRSLKTVDVRATDGMDLVRVFLSTPGGGRAAERVGGLLKMQQDIAPSSSASPPRVSKCRNTVPEWTSSRADVT